MDQAILKLTSLNIWNQLYKKIMIKKIIQKDCQIDGDVNNGIQA